jgi:hypothetical protein
MSRQKNIAQWCKLIAIADPGRWFFIQIGQVYENTLAADDLAAYKRLVASLPVNMVLHEQYLPDEREFNFLIHISDVLFAVYRDFRISSNMLGKAAVFEKPILVSDRYLMGDRVRRYGIGLGVSEDDADEMLAGLQKLTSNPIPVDNFAKFRDDFSTAAMATRLKSFFDRAL